MDGDMDVVDRFEHVLAKASPEAVLLFYFLRWAGYMYGFSLSLFESARRSRRQDTVFSIVVDAAINGFMYLIGAALIGILLPVPIWIVVHAVLGCASVYYLYRATVLFFNAVLVH